MKMLKKLLAIVLTGAMALTLFTACGSNAVTDKSIADAMNDIAKLNDEEVTFKPRAKERGLAKKLAALLEGKPEFNAVSDEELANILGTNAGGANKDLFVWVHVVRTDGVGSAGQAVRFMQDILTNRTMMNSVEGKEPANKCYMGTALCKMLDEKGQQVTKRIIVVTAEAVDRK